MALILSLIPAEIIDGYNLKNLETKREESGNEL